MTRGEFWAGKLVRASSLTGTTAVEDVADAVLAECVSHEGNGENEFCIHFADGSWLAAYHIEGAQFGQVVWGEK